MRKKLLCLPALILTLLLTRELPRSVPDPHTAASLSPAAKTVSVAAKRPRGPYLAQVGKAAPAGARIGAATTITPHLQALLADPAMKVRHRELSTAVLGLLEPACQDRLETFSVLYNKPKHRGLAGKGVVLVSGEVPDREFVGLLLHEALGHFRDITCLTGDPRSTPSAFRDGADPVYRDDPSALFYGISWTDERTRKPAARRDDFVTGYAYQADSFEDLAESVTYYMTQEEALRERAAKNPVLARKLRWLETFMPKPRDITVIGGQWDGSIAWDATKLAFQWMER